jgi:hypothetical protein
VRVDGIDGRGGGVGGGSGGGVTRRAFAIVRLATHRAGRARLEMIGDQRRREAVMLAVPVAHRRRQRTHVMRRQRLANAVVSRRFAAMRTSARSQRYRLHTKICQQFLYNNNNYDNCDNNRCTLATSMSLCL